MYHPMLIFERHSGCLLAARLRPGNASRHARIPPLPLLLRLAPRLEAAFPGVKIRLRGDAGFLPCLCSISFARSSRSSTPSAFQPTACSGRASEIFAFYNDRRECENRIEEFKNGFRADRLSCHRFLANAFRLLLHAAAYNLVNFFPQQLPQPWRSAQIETLRAQLFKIGARIRQTARCIRIHLASGWPFQNLFRNAALASSPG
jgi:hypothetical protein